MGTWGPKIYEDDFACEVVDSYVERLYAGDDPAAASMAVVTEFGECDVDEYSVFWLTLASVQSDYGRLVDEVRDQALAIIESGEDLARWNGAPERKRVLQGLRRRLEAPPKPVRKLTTRAAKRVEGDIFRLVLGDGRYAFGRVLTQTERAFYDLVTDEKRPALDEIVAANVLFVVGSTDNGFATREWSVIGNRPLEPHLRQPITFVHQPVGSDRCDVYDIWTDTTEVRPASACLGMELWGAWSAHHCRDRILDELAGEPCKWIRRVKVWD